MARMISRQEAADILNVSGQTISNWVEKGVLHGHYSCDGRKTMLIDRKSIEKYFDTLEDLAFMEKRIALQKKTLKEETEALEKDLNDMTTAKYLFGKGVPEYLLRDIFNCVVYVASDEILCSREKEVLTRLMNGCSVDEVAEHFCLTRTRILQIANKAIRKITTMKSWPKAHDDYKRTLSENSKITVLLENQQARIRELEIQLGININKCGDDASGIPGYSKMELAEVLGRKLVDEDLTVRSLNCLKAADIEYVWQLVRCSKTDLLKFRNFGRKSLIELDDYLSNLNLSFGMDLDHLIDAEVDYFLKEVEKRNK
ncbi:MAG: helix-turn-helix domain-containing protein [Prevotella sp.]|nr:helix-turn-helix domain-containing protein [Prevotella sp.]